MGRNLIENKFMFYRQGEAGPRRVQQILNSVAPDEYPYNCENW